VDVRSPGVWDRESDALSDDLARWVPEEEAFSSESHKSDEPNPSSPKDGQLSESNLKLWLSMVNCPGSVAPVPYLMCFIRTTRASSPTGNTALVSQYSADIIGSRDIC
jgi:hypothetical protein